jgi:glycosyltransferase
MNNFPLISVLSVFKNDKAMLKLVMDSILEQNYPKVEHIIFDGDSTDGSADLLMEYEAKYLLKGYVLKWKSEKDRNSEEAFTKAARIVKGDYFIQFMNVFVSENSLAILAHEIITNNYDGVCGGYIYQKNGIITRRWSGKQLPWRLGWMCATETLLLRSSILKKYLIADEFFSSSSDYNFQLSLFTDRNIQIKSLQIPITIFIAGGQSNGGITNNLKSIKWDFIALKAHKISFPWFTSLCKCFIAFFAYLFAPRTKLPLNMLQKIQK